MLICSDLRTGTGCGGHNRAGAKYCKHCGKSLRYALELHDAGALISHYRIARVLGYGGFGAVYEAENTRQAGTHVAVKETFDADSIRNLQHEFAALSHSQHPHLPRYYEIFELQGNGYLVMELVPGQSLFDLLKDRRGALPEARVVSYAVQLCDVLDYLHGQVPPILHRDIKPGNIRLTPQGVLKLVDFGLVKRGTQHTRSTIRGMGTPAYAPLEQWSGGTSASSDIYSLGATLYHLLTGIEPLPAPERLAKSPDPLTAPHKFNSAISLQVSEAIMTALGLRQCDRYANVMEFKSALMNAAHPAQEFVPAPSIARTIVVAANDEGDYASIGEAIKDVPSGSRIIVRPGTYRESLVIDKPLEIFGDGQVERIVIESTAAACVLSLAESAMVRGLTLRSKIGDKRDFNHAVDIPHGKLVLEECDISSDALACVAIHGTTAQPLIRRCRIHDGQQGGVFVYDKGQGTIEDCDIFNNAVAGVEIWQESAPILRGCRIHDNKGGVNVHHKGRGVFEDCDIFSNAVVEVQIRNEGAPIIRRCNIHDGKQASIVVYDDGAGTLEACNIYGNSNAGIEIRSRGNPLVRHCTIRDQQEGVFVYGGGAGRIEDCDIFNNTLAAVEITENSTPIFKRCVIHDSKGGVNCHKQGRGIIEDCDIFSCTVVLVQIKESGNLIVRRCKIHDAPQSAVLIGDGAVTLEDCDISGNTLAGVDIRTGGDAVVRHCRINRNRFVAVRAADDGAGLVEDCDLTGNARGAWSLLPGSRVRGVRNRE